MLSNNIGERLAGFGRWCSHSANLAELFLILVNGLLAIKTLSNLTSIVIEDQDELILEFNGHLLLDSKFKLATILMNLVVFLATLSSLLAILFTTTSTSGHSVAHYNEEYNMKRHKLIRYSSISQLLLAFIVLLLMGKLWFCPIKMELDRLDWSNFVANYRYETLDYSASPFDRIQRTLGCCGYRSPAEWTNSTTKSAPSANFLAPSCCSNPISSQANSSGSGSSGSSSISGDDGDGNGIRIHYCARLDEIIMRIDSNGLEIPMGCQQRLSERDSRFLFQLRMRLLALLAALLMMSQVSLTFYLPSLMLTTANNNNNSLQPRAATVNGRHLPPNYWNAIGNQDGTTPGRATVLVLVDRKKKDLTLELGVVGADQASQRLDTLPDLSRSTAAVVANY